MTALGGVVVVVNLGSELDFLELSVGLVTAGVTSFMADSYLYLP